MKKVIKEDVKKKNKAKSKAKAVENKEKKINKKCIIGIVVAVVIILAIIIAIVCNTVKNEEENNAIREEILNFNAEIEKYSGSQMGKDVKELVSYLIENTNEAGDENELPDIRYVAGETAEDTLATVFSELEDATIESSLEEPNLILLSSLRAKINNSHYYDISVSYNETGYISKIIIKY